MKKLTVILTLLFAFLPVTSPGQGVLSNGQRHDGTISPAGDADSWTCTVAQGATLFFRVGATNFPPRIRVFDPANAPVGTVTSPSAGTRDVHLTVSAATAGEYTVVVDSANAGATGTYGLHAAIVPGAFSTMAGDEGGEIQSGANNAAILTLGDLDLWQFTAEAGDAIMLRMGGDFAPWIRLFNPEGGLVGEAVSPSLGTRDVYLIATATNAGTYLVVAGSTSSGGIGDYNINLAHIPSQQVTSAGDEGGALVNGAKTSATITRGDLDVWQFQANAGDSLMLRMGAGFPPWMRLYGPDGILVEDAVSPSTGTRDVQLSATATNSGTYTLVASSTTSAGAGDYDISLVRAPAEFITSPGDDGGPLQNGNNHKGIISIGDLDLYSFAAEAGDHVILRMGAEFTPSIRVYNPSGAIAGEVVSPSTGTRDVVLNLTATNAGLYTVVASSTVASGDGNYDLHFAHIPGEFSVPENDQGGALTNGSTNPGEITLGDLDMWSFSAEAGAAIYLRVGATFPPTIQLFDPAGAMIGQAVSSSTGTRDVNISSRATNAGIYTVVVSSTTSAGQGTYNLSLVQAPLPLVISPGDEGGILLNGATNTAVMAVGDLDAWTFYGTVGDSNVFRVVSTNFAPSIRLYGPGGDLVGEAQPTSSGTRAISLSYELTKDPGNYTVVVSSGVANQSGSYAFKQSRWAPDLNMPEIIEVDEGTTVAFDINAQDPDQPSLPLQFQLLASPAGTIFELDGSTNSTVAWATSEETGPFTTTFVASVTDVVNGRSFTRTNSVEVVVREINLPPQLTVPDDLAVDELTAVVLTATATDPDLPANELTFSLLNPPEGMTINPQTGEIHWTPTEAQGPSVNEIVVVVTDFSPDAANEKNLSDTNSFILTVREVNLPPTLATPSNQVINEGELLSVSAGSTDPDLPANARVFGLLSPPAGAQINPATGLITWTPSEAQGPTNAVITVVVTDNNPDAINAKSLSVTNSFSVSVREINVPPTLELPENQTIAELQPLSVTAIGADTDLPANGFTFSVLNPPAGLAINPASGVITWTPTEAQGPTNVTVTVVLTDSSPDAFNEKSLSVTNSFTVAVSESNSAPVLPALQDISINEGATLTVTNTATDADLPANTLVYTLSNAPEGMTVDAKGVITWITTEVVGPTNLTVTTVVTDNGVPAKSATNSFVLTIQEVNEAPVFEAITNQVIRYGFPFNLKPVATDPDLPANTLAYSIVTGPDGLAINPSTGELNWTPAQPDVGAHDVTLKVTDNGSPSKEATISFQITVTGDESRLEIVRLPSGLVQITIHGNAGSNYELQRSSNFSDWERQLEFRLDSATFIYIDPDSTTTRNRSFRLKTL